VNQRGDRDRHRSYIRFDRLLWLAVLLLTGASACTLILDPGRFDSESEQGGSNGNDSGLNEDSGNGDEDSSTPPDSGAPETSDPGNTDCGGGVNTMTDSRNCGWCGHDCRGSTCENGMCKPILVVNATSPFRVAVDQTYVYWVNNQGSPNGVVGRVRNTNPNDVKIISSNEAKPRDLVVDRDYVYWTVQNSGRTHGSANGFVRRAAINSSDTVIETLASNQCYPNAIRITGEFVFWTNQCDQDPTGEVMKARIFGDGEPTVVATTQNRAPTGICADTDYVYWASKGPTNSGIERAPIGGGASTRLQETNGKPGISLVCNETHLYWPHFEGYAIYRIPKTGSGLQTIHTTTAPIQPNTAVTDGVDLYYVAKDSGELHVVRLNTDGGVIDRKMLGGLSEPEGVTFDSTWVYVANMKADSIVKVAR
jgi:hypothetical protein